jgi:hypothetical protein
MLAFCLTLLFFGYVSAVLMAKGYDPASTDQTDALAVTALAQLRAYLASSSNQTCTVENAAKRKEWYVLSTGDKFPM